MSKIKVHRNVYTLQDRLDLIAQQIDKSLTTLQIQTPTEKRPISDLAFEIVRGTRQHGQDGESQELVAVFNWVKQNIEYRQETLGYDVYRSAGRTLQIRAGDCDDHCILNAALLSSLSYYTGSRIISPDQNGWHIYLIVGAWPRHNPQVIFPFDTTQPGSYVGWEPEPAQRRYMLQCDFRGGRAVGLRSVT